MKKFWKNYLENNLYFYIFGIAAILLLGVSFVLPPAGVISPSALQGAAELFAWATLGAVIHSVDSGKVAKITRGDVNVEVGDKTNGEYD